MNKKQMRVLWIMAVLISLISLGYGLDENDPVLVSVPVILIGGVLIYEFRDKDKSDDGTPLTTSKLLFLIWAILAFQAMFLMAQYRTGRSVWKEVHAIEGDVSSMEGNLSNIESNVSEIQNDVSNIETRQ